MPDETEGAQSQEEALEQGSQEQAVDSAGQQDAGQPNGGARTYTQEEVDRTVKGRIDKQNEKHRAELAKSQKAAKDAAERAEAAEKKVAELEAAKSRAEAVAKSASEMGVSVQVLGRMIGDTAEEIEANAKMLAEFTPKAAYPDVPDKGQQVAATMTKADIDKIRNPVEQLKAIRENKELFE